MPFLLMDPPGRQLWIFDSCRASIIYRSDGTMKKFITSQIYNEIAFSLYSSLLSFRYFELGRSNKVRHRFRLLFFKRTILLLIHHQNLQFGTNVSRRLPFIT